MADCTSDLKVFHRRAHDLGREADGSIELAFMRGYQAGYEQAVADEKAGQLDVGNALTPNR